MSSSIVRINAYKFGGILWSTRCWIAALIRFGSNTTPWYVILMFGIPAIWTLYEIKKKRLEMCQIYMLQKGLFHLRATCATFSKPSTIIANRRSCPFSWFWAALETATKPTNNKTKIFFGGHISLYQDEKWNWLSVTIFDAFKYTRQSRCYQ